MIALRGSVCCFTRRWRPATNWLSLIRAWTQLKAVPACRRFMRWKFCAPVKGACPTYASLKSTRPKARLFAWDGPRRLIRWPRSTMPNMMSPVSIWPMGRRLRATCATWWKSAQRLPVRCVPGIAAGGVVGPEPMVWWIPKWKHLRRSKINGSISAATHQPRCSTFLLALINSFFRRSIICDRVKNRRPLNRWTLSPEAPFFTKCRRTFGMNLAPLICCP